MIEVKEHARNPVRGAGLFSKLFFCWLNTLMKKGSKQTLVADDMYSVTEENLSSYLGDKLEREWKKEIEKEKPSLMKALCRCFGAQLGWLGIVVLLEEATRLAQPLLLVRLLVYFSLDEVGMSTLEAYMYALGLALTSAALTVVHHPYFFYNGVVGMRMRIACCSILYRKALRLNNKALAQTTTGHIINLLTNDVNRFDYVTLFLHYLWVAPLQAAAVLVILWYYIGPASLAGFVLLVVITPLQGILGKMFSRLRLQTAVETDERVRLMEQMIAGMKVIKMYCWEKPFIELIAAARRSELVYLMKTLAAQLATMEFGFVSLPFYEFAIFATYHVLYHRPPPIVAVFIVLTTSSIICDSCFVNISLQMRRLPELITTCKRLQDFLMLEEISEPRMLEQSLLSSDRKISLDAVCSKWVESSDTFTLYNITVTVKAGELLAVIGSVGAGKTSLLMAVLGELPCVAGCVDVKGSIAYAPQQAWIFPGTVRQNILFGKPFVAIKYERAVHCCALEKDLLLLPYGDQTLVGDRGVVLSGGQRARIGLARAVYCDADLYLLDDPLAAVDAAVSKHLFSECINGALKDRPRILVTHQLQYLKAATRVLILKEGAVLGMGPYDQLASSGIEIPQFLEHAIHVANRKPKNTDCQETSPESPLIYAQSATTVLSSTPSSVPPRTSAHMLHTLAVPCPPHTKGMPQHFPSSLSVVAQLTSSRGSLSAMMAFEDANVHLGNDTDGDDAHSALPVTNEMPTPAKPLHPQQLHAEEVAKGSVSLSAYTSYFTAGAKACTLVLAMILLLVSQGAFVTCDWWLSYWSSREEAYSKALAVAMNQSSAYNESLLNSHATDLSTPAFNITDASLITYGQQSSIYLYIYIGLMIISIILSCLRMSVFFKICVEAARNIHTQMFMSVVRSPMRFFDTNPAGRILNRFSKDISNIDDLLPGTFYDFISCFLLIIGIIVVASAINPWVLIPVAPIVGFFLYIRKFYLCTSRAIKRLEATTRSPVLSHINATLAGLYSLRAFKMQSVFVIDFDKHQDLHTEAWYLFLATNRWLAIRLDWLCVIFITAVTIFSVVAKNNVGLSANLVGLTVTYAISLMGVFQWGVRQSAEVENYMTSVERALEYIKLPPEAPLETDLRPPTNWPVRGAIAADGACLKYSDEDSFVLKDMTFNIRGGEKIGICGRTGAGKSSLLMMLFRLCEHTGKVTIDDIDISSIGLHDLRSKISIIPQEPTLFGGTVRYNLDPFREHSEASLREVLAQVQLLSVVEDLPSGIDAAVAENGSNFSVGQQQLLCLARALLRRNRILVVDEATANVDPGTDALIQETIKRRFCSLTVLTIAHRLNTIIEADRVMVLDEGRVHEFDEPYMLMQRPGTLFRALVEQTGSKDCAALEALARAAHDARLKTLADPNDLQSTG